MRQHWLVMEGDGPPAPFRARLAGAGRHLPTTHLSTDELMASTRHRTKIDLERLTGIRERRVSDGEESSLETSPPRRRRTASGDRATGRRTTSTW